MTEIVLEVPSNKVVLQIEPIGVTIARFDGITRILLYIDKICYYNNTDLVACFFKSGLIFIKGRLRRNEPLSAGLTSFQDYDSTTKRVVYSIGDFRLMELDMVTGDLLLAERELVNVPATELGTSTPDGIIFGSGIIKWTVGGAVLARLSDDPNLTDFDVLGTVVNNAFP